MWEGLTMGGEAGGVTASTCTWEGEARRGRELAGWEGGASVGVPWDCAGMQRRGYCVHMHRGGREGGAACLIWRCQPLWPPPMMYRECYTCHSCPRPPYIPIGVQNQFAT